MKHPLIFSATCVALVLGFAGPVTAAGCAPYLCYVDLSPGGGFICPNANVYTVLTSDLTAATHVNQLCDPSQWQAVVVQVEIPEECSGVTVWAEYSGEPHGLTLDIGDSATNDGFGGDAGSLPAGQNAELHVLDNTLTVFGAAADPADNDELINSQLALKDGALNVVVKNQFVSFGQPYQALATPDLGHLFFLPATPTSPANRTVYVGINRGIAPIDGPNLVNNGCGARRIFMTLN